MSNAPDYFAEELVIGLCLKYPDWVAELDEILFPKDFKDLILGKVYKLILKMLHLGQPIGDMRFVMSTFQSSDIFAENGSVTPESILDFIPEKDYRKKDFLELADRIIESSQGDSLASLLDNVAKSKESLAKRQAMLRAGLAKLETRSRVQAISWLQMATEECTNIEKANRSGVRDGIKTGIEPFDHFNKMICGGELWVIAAGTSVGKTAFSMELCMRMASAGKRPLFASAEMTQKQMAHRAISRIAKVAGSRLREADNLTPDELMGVRASIVKSESLHNAESIFVSGMTIDGVCAAIRASLIRKRFDIIVVDYLTKIRPRSGADSQQHAKTVSAELKDLAIFLDVPVVVLAQLNKAGNDKTRRPTQNDIGESKAIADDADFVTLLYDFQGDHYAAMTKARMSAKWLTRYDFKAEQMGFGFTIDQYDTSKDPKPEAKSKSNYYGGYQYKD